MIEFNNLCKDSPYQLFKKKYNESLKAKQENIEAISISSYSKKFNEVNSRFVNIKFINNNEFVFFSNYNLPKSLDFDMHNQISALFFWPSTNTQIRMKANIAKTSMHFNNNYFINRDRKKNALAISSKQSNKIDSYEHVKKNYKHSLKYGNFKECPDYWGGFTFIPYYFEFWDGHKNRINMREVFEFKDNKWNNFILQP